MGNEDNFDDVNTFYSKNQENQHSQDGQYNQNVQYNQDGQYNQNGQYNQGGQYNQNGQYNQDGQYNQNVQYSQDGQYNQNGQYNQDGQYNQATQYNQDGQYNLQYGNYNYQDTGNYQDSSYRYTKEELPPDDFMNYGNEYSQNANGQPEFEPVKKKKERKVAKLIGASVETRLSSVVSAREQEIAALHARMKASYDDHTLQSQQLNSKVRVQRNRCGFPCLDKTCMRFAATCLGLPP